MTERIVDLMHLNRRAFFSIILGAPLGLAVRPAATFLLEAPVAGFRFHDGPAHEHSLRVGDEIVLRREHRNQYDANAIALHLPHGPKLGYFPQKLNDIPARLLDGGIVLSATISAIRPAPAPPWKRLSVAVMPEPH